jgi:hypothetical protein
MPVIIQRILSEVGEVVSSEARGVVFVCISVFLRE